MSNKNKFNKVEYLLSEEIKNIYRDRLEHQLDNISYKLFDRTLIVILEGAITPPEKLLKNNDRLHLAQQVRRVIDEAINPQIKNIIEEVMNVEVTDFLSDTTIENNISGAIAILEFKSNKDSKNS
ncbi:DUF2294 domain-containing protein [Waterburya agarophytonicola K14]|uniref:DUF2294 domain-containing protein n=1 Tax=Waterburya agarophytonicola KI4 TaxID=2874699 RepID=A0A964FI90_9CYAN|nr:DUF2294 domain-containing protein [Waterburya agarophytonicola]MCC0178259.1 DUF2294 domain-containing protein [Waterburya agarophytonicola KI4]